jgi:hypothetical protein
MRASEPSDLRVGVVDAVRGALAGSGIELVASCPIELYDARAPSALQSSEVLPGARGLIVAGSAGPLLWRRFRARMDADRRRWDEANPYDRFVADTLDQADHALTSRGVRFRRFEAAFHAQPRVDFVTLARLVGLGEPGPFRLLIHSEHGAWWALRGAWLVDADVEPARAEPSPCVGCHAPCVGGWQNAAGARATPEVRARCVVGQSSRYDDDQIAYHTDRVVTAERLRRA